MRRRGGQEGAGPRSGKVWSSANGEFRDLRNMKEPPLNLDDSRADRSSAFLQVTALQHLVLLFHKCIHLRVTCHKRTAPLLTERLALPTSV